MSRGHLALHDPSLRRVDNASVGNVKLPCSEQSEVGIPSAVFLRVPALPQVLGMPDATICSMSMAVGIVSPVGTELVFTLLSTTNSLT